MYEHQARNKKGEMIPNGLKSHIDRSTGDLYPANPNGKATIATHVRGDNRVTGVGTKSDSPYTSFSEGAGDAYFGNREVVLDSNRLRADIANKEVTGVRIIDNPTMIKILDRRVVLAQKRLDNATSSTTKQFKAELASARYDLQNARDTSEVLIKGVIPGRYLKVGK